MRRPPGHYRLRRTTRGDLNPRAKLSHALVEEIHRRVGEGESKAAIARELGVHETTVGKAALRDRWAYGEERRERQVPREEGS